MSVHQRRINAIKAILAGSVIATKPEHSIIESEFDEVWQVRRIPKLTRRRLLQVLHSTRALDTALQIFLDHHMITIARPSLGAYLEALVGHTSLSLARRLPRHDRQHFQRNIVRVRNRYMHRAGDFPGADHEVLTLISEMEACLVQILSL